LVELNLKDDMCNFLWPLNKEKKKIYSNYITEKKKKINIDNDYYLVNYIYK